MMSLGTALPWRVVLAQTFQNQTPVEMFDLLFTVFMVLGTVVGTIVIAYTLYNAFKYRTTAPDEEGRYDIQEEETDDEAGVARPQLGEVPTGQGKGGGKKLFVSFGISATIVLSLIVFSYTMLYYTENPDEALGKNEEAFEIDVTAQQFKFTYTYPNGTTMNELYVPKGKQVRLNITSKDVIHNYAIPEFRVKRDAIPNQYNQAWFEPEKIGTYEAVCYELCGTGHSQMRGMEVHVMTQKNFQSWYISENEQTEVNN